MSHKDRRKTFAEITSVIVLRAGRGPTSAEKPSQKTKVVPSW